MASRHTVESHATALRPLAVFAADRHGIRPCTLKVGHLDVDTILPFLDRLENERGRGFHTRKIHLAATRAFHRVLEFRHPDYLDMAAYVHAIPRKNGDVPALDCLDRNEVNALLKVPDTTTRSGTRDRAMLCLAYHAGLRVYELIGLSLHAVRVPGATNAG